MGLGFFARTHPRRSSDVSNVPRKSVPLEVGDRTYQLRYTTNSLIEIEEQTGLTIQELGQKFLEGKVGLRDMRIFVWAGILHQHDDFTLAEAGHIIDEVGISEVATKAAEAFQAAFPDAEGNEGKNAFKGASAGTGARS